MAILSALTSTSVNRLRASWQVRGRGCRASFVRAPASHDVVRVQLVPKAALVAFHELLTLMSSDKGYAACRQRLQSFQRPCLPYLGALTSNGAAAVAAATCRVDVRWRVWAQVCTLPT
jgi:hypothetical protein